MDRWRDPQATRALEAVQTRIKELEAAAELQRRELEKTEEEISLYEEKRRHLVSQLAPIQVLPEDLVMEIWGHLEPLVPNRSRTICLPIALYLSHVNTRWRAITLRTPSMWRDIHVYFVGYGSVSLLRLLIQRSMPCMLNIKVAGGRTHRPFERLGYANRFDVVEEIMTELVECSNRWQSLHVQRASAFAIAVEDPGQIYDMLCDVDVPNLRHFCVQWPGLRDSRRLIKGHAPFLSDAYLYGTPLKTNQALLRGLTNLELGETSSDYRLSPKELQTILTQCPALNHLGLDGLCIDLTFAMDDFVPIPLISLESLKLRFEHCVPSSFISTIFGILSFPQLYSLELIDMTPASYEALIAHFERTPLPSVSHICLDLPPDEDTNFVVGEDLVTRFLALFPNTRHLTTLGKEEYILSALTTPAVGQLPWPLLDTLSTYVPTHITRSFIQHRHSAGFPITTLNLLSESEAYIYPDNLKWCLDNVKVKIWHAPEPYYKCFQKMPCGVVNVPVDFSKLNVQSRSSTSTNRVV